MKKYFYIILSLIIFGTNVVIHAQKIELVKNFSKDIRHNQIPLYIGNQPIIYPEYFIRAIANQTNRRLIKQYLSDMNAEKKPRWKYDTNWAEEYNGGWANSWWEKYTWEDISGYGYQPKTYLYKVWNGSEWYNDFRYEWTYTDFTREVSAFRWNGSGWQPDYNTLYTFDFDKTIIIYTTYVDGNEQKKKVEYFYDDYSYDLVQVLTSEYDYSTSSYTPTQKLDISYDDYWSYDVYSELIGNSWVNTMKTETYWLAPHDYYDPSYWYDYNWNGSAWVNSEYSELEYDDYLYEASFLVQTWGGAEWINSTYDEYTWVPNPDYVGFYLPESEISNIWSGGWQPSEATYYEYDANFNLIGERGGSWVNNVYNDAWRYTYSVFDEQKRYHEELYEINPGGKNWTPVHKVHYTYDGETSVGNDINQTPLQFELGKCYPNPFSKGLSGKSNAKIEFSITKSGEYILQVFNMIGQKITVIEEGFYAPGKYVTEFNTGNLSSGIYIYQLSGNNGKISKKMLILK